MLPSLQIEGIKVVLEDQVSGTDGGPHSYRQTSTKCGQRGFALEFRVARSKRRLDSDNGQQQYQTEPDHLQNQLQRLVMQTHRASVTLY